MIRDVLGNFAWTLAVPLPQIPTFRRSKSPAVIFGNAAGDHLLALPALRALSSLFSGRLCLICMPGSRQLFFSDLPLRLVCETQMRSRSPQRVFDARSVARRIGKCDLFLSLNPWRSVSLDRLVPLLSPDTSIGFSPAFHVPLVRRRTRHAADEAFLVPKVLDRSLQLNRFAFPFRLPRQVRPRIRDFLRAVAPGKRVLAIHSESKPEKRWPRDRLRKVVAEFLRRHPDFVVFVVDFRKPRLGLPRFRDRILHSRGLPLAYAFGVVREADLFLGVDSCMLHAADLFRVPGVGLFGPTDPRRYGFRFTSHRHVRRGRSMNSIPVPAVLKALESVLSRSDVATTRAR